MGYGCWHSGNVVIIAYDFEQSLVTSKIRDRETEDLNSQFPFEEITTSFDVIQMSTFLFLLVVVPILFHLYADS